MKVKIFIILTVSILSLYGCSTPKTMKIGAVAAPKQQVGYQDTVISQKKHFVSLAPYREQNPANKITSFILFVKNCGEKPINVSSNNISVIFEGNTKEWASRKITVLSLDDLKNQFWRWWHQSYQDDALPPDVNFSCGLDTNGSYSCWTSVTPSKQFKTYDGGVTWVIERQLKLAEELVMKPQTLLPEESGGGLVVCDTRGMNADIEGNFDIVVSVDSEKHEFTFNCSLYK